MQTLLRMADVGLYYHTPDAEICAVKGLTLSIAAGEFVAIIGPSGCGKTSALSLLMGLLIPTHGRVTRADARLRMGYMLQHDHLLSWRTVEQNVLLGLEIGRRLTPDTRARAVELLETYGLGEFRGAKPAQLSGGMRQKVALIRTLATAPDVLLLDEPFSALDYQTRLTIADEVYRIIKSENKTAVLVTHDISEAASMADRVLVFSKRPARVILEREMPFCRGASPLIRRNDPAFAGEFSVLWEAMER